MHTAQVRQQRPCTRFDQMESILEIGLRAVPGVGHLCFFDIMRDRKKHGDFGGMVLRRALLQVKKMPAIHGIDVVKIEKILGRNDARFQVINRHTVRTRDLDRARIRLFAGVITVGTGRRRDEPAPQPLGMRQMTKYPFRRGRAADIAGTNKKYLDDVIHPDFRFFFFILAPPVLGFRHGGNGWNIVALKPADVQLKEGGNLESVLFGDVYFQRGQAIPESDYVFLQKNNLPERFTDKNLRRFCIGELGFGSGINFLLTLALWRARAPKNAFLDFVSIEKFPLRQSDLATLYESLGLENDNKLLAQYPPLVEGHHSLHFGNARLTLCFGDAANVMAQLQDNTVDAWFLDGFAPAKNPDMWTNEIFSHIARVSREGATFSTFTAVGEVRRGLKAAGFEVKKIRGYGIKRHMTVGRMTSTPVPVTIPENVAIIGAGIAGAAAAHALAKRGLHVTVFDRHDQPAAEASGNPVGILYPKLSLPSSPIGIYHQHAFCYTRNLLNDLKLPSWRPCGVEKRGEDRTRIEKILQLCGYPPDYACLDAKGQVLLPLAGMLDPREFCHVLLAPENIEKKFGHDIDNIYQEDDAWIVGENKFDAVVIAAANGSNIWPQTGFLSLQALRGQITFARETPASAILDHVICHDGYITPATDGLHCIGATFQKEPVGAPDLRDEDHRENLRKLVENVPEAGIAASDIVGGRAAWRATTLDKLPTIGKVPVATAFLEGAAQYHHGLYITTGFGAHGMSGAPLAGEMIANMMTQTPLPVPDILANALAPERFLLRQRKKSGSQGIIRIAG